ncbi:hypothetical protein DWW28_03925 [Sellimonas intestinalis]|uniref:hypothetical protein n=1 Tax=Sellimonas intestinalis TaxID=1653434 RepID=UPI000E418F17|nr:hypothetical protein [Sellimonas intestinalis]RGE54631.1 hypothetical protein DWW28_03925 [Sellimonas intestinalis]
MFKIVIVDDDRQMQRLSFGTKSKRKQMHSETQKFRSFLLRKPFWQRPNRKSTEKRAICSL